MTDWESMSKESQLAYLRLAKKMRDIITELREEVSEEFGVTPLEDRYAQGYMWGKLDAVQAMTYAWDELGRPFDEDDFRELRGLAPKKAE